jgi:hypothetical protein
MAGRTPRDAGCPFKAGCASRKIGSDGNGEGGDVDPTLAFHFEAAIGKAANAMVALPVSCQWTGMPGRMWHATTSTLFGEPAMVFNCSSSSKC